MGDHPNVARTRQALDALASGDMDAYREFISENIVWHVGGDHPFTGDYRGRDALFEYFQKVDELTDGSLQVDREEILADDTHAAVFARVTAQRERRSLDVVLAQALTVDKDGRLTEYWALANDQRSVDEFWSTA